MKMVWEMEGDRLVCHWSETRKRGQNTPVWMQTAETGSSVETGAPTFLDFTRLSPFAGRRWYAPHGSR